MYQFIAIISCPRQISDPLGFFIPPLSPKFLMQKKHSIRAGSADLDSFPGFLSEASAGCHAAAGSCCGM
jgi:hypothetical protein